MIKTTLITLAALLSGLSSFAHASTYVYCGLPDGSDWEWLLDSNDNYQTIDGIWGRAIQANGNYYNVFRVNEALFETKAFSCPGGYVPQPAESGASRWEVFEIIRADGSRYLIDGHKTIYNAGGSSISSAFRL
ncbi:hypothetical protein ACODM8_14805 [Vibrio ostreicida]|uniref:Uncharacterized protein n=1 Tax=Vibrio ostreicida TaxID=526588 RepID=A0ABT8C0P3_9VIBR|nr:hypothetical protein [Vibrio ostreicida]MDN3612508.1 hypothetical protein [Vibrio ostreicida]NPD09135.1 hypothetical protein [Vibrio ostreicida]